MGKKGVSVGKERDVKDLRNSIYAVFTFPAFFILRGSFWRNGA
jgi:hypothetical protein